MFNINLLISIVTVVITNQVVAYVDENRFGSVNYKNQLWYIMAHATQTRFSLRKGLKDVKFMIVLVYLKLKLLIVLLVVELMIPV